MGPLFLAYCALGQAVLVASARFYFDENQMLALPGDQIDFGVACRQAIIAGHDNEAFAAQVTVGQVLATAARSQVRTPAPPPGNVPEPVEQNSDHLPEVVARAGQNLSYLEEAMTQRLTGISDHEATGLAQEIIEGSNLFLGRTSNLVRILAAHSPYIARWFLGLVAAVRQPNLGAQSDVRLRNLATIKTSIANECNYCTTHTSIFGEALGFKVEDLEALKGQNYETNPRFNERERAAIAWSEAMTRNAAKSDKAVWENMRRLFTDTEIVEISMACAMFNMINRLNDSFWTELEPEEYNRRQANAVQGRTVEDIEAYAGRFAATGEAEREQHHSVAAERSALGAAD
jgi:alkylhydroperoxidase family enzyme